MKKTTIGGQALIEGVMMKGPESIAIAVRKPDGEIIVDKKQLSAKSRLSKTPIVRGMVEFFRILVIGIKAIMYSAEFVELRDESHIDSQNSETHVTIRKHEMSGDHSTVDVPEICEAPEAEEGPEAPEAEERLEATGKSSKMDAFLEKVFGNKLNDAIVYFSAIIALCFSVGLFILLPNLLASFLHFNKQERSGVISYNLFEGLIRIIIFFGYIILASRLKDIQRVWQYHGAEHKTIHCYEHEEEVTVENVRKFTTKHPRCGTSFMFIVMIVSIVVFSLIGWHSIIINILARLALIPVVAGLSYEILKFVGRCDWKVIGILNAPGLLLQHFTTKEPDDKQIEVAIEAFKGVLTEDKNADVW